MLVKYLNTTEYFTEYTGLPKFQIDKLISTQTNERMVSDSIPTRYLYETSTTLRPIIQLGWNGSLVNYKQM